MKEYPRIKKNCLRCNAEFITYTNSHKIYCEDCKHLVRLERKRTLSKPHICKTCGRSFYVDYRKESALIGEPRFCCKSCANTFSSKSVDHLKTKKAKCIECGKEIEIKFNASEKTAKCKECKKKEKRVSKVKCQYCEKEISTHNIKRHENACSKNPNAVHSRHFRKRKDCREGYIYLIENKINGKQYIGKHVGKPEDSKNYLGSGIVITEAIKKYGRENFSKRILEYTQDDDLNKLEELYIQKYKTRETGYNLTSGGDGGPVNKGKFWYTNGKENVLRFECPEGFWKKYK